MTATDASESRSTSATLSMTSVMRSAAPEVLPYGMKLSPSYPAGVRVLHGDRGVGRLLRGLIALHREIVTRPGDVIGFRPGGCAFCLGAALDLRAAFFDARVIVDVRAYP